MPELMGFEARTEFNYQVWFKIWAANLFRYTEEDIKTMAFKHLSRLDHIEDEDLDIVSFLHNATLTIHIVADSDECEEGYVKVGVGYMHGTDYFEKQVGVLPESLRGGNNNG